MKRKMIGILAGLAIILSFTACGEKEENSVQPEKSAHQENIQDNLEKEVTAKKDESIKNGNQKYSISIDGEEYDFPMSYEEFKAYGWTYYKPEEDDVSKWNGGLQGGMTGAGMFYDKNDIKCLEFFFYNPSDEFATYDQCQVAGVGVSYGQTIEGKDAENFIKIPQGMIVINKDVKIGEASKEQVHQSLGKDWTQSSQETSDYKQLNNLLYYFTDEISGNAYMTMKFDETGVWKEMTYINIK